MGKWLGEQHSNLEKRSLSERVGRRRGKKERNLLVGVCLGRVASCELWMEGRQSVIRWKVVAQGVEHDTS